MTRRSPLDPAYPAALREEANERCQKIIAEVQAEAVDELKKRLTAEANRLGLQIQKDHDPLTLKELIRVLVYDLDQPEGHCPKK